MKYIYHPDALVEYADATLYYEERVPGLGADFTKEIDDAISGILMTPVKWRRIEEDVRRCLVKRFPYGILYTVEQDQIYLVAVMHLSRAPGYWRHRII